MGIDCAAENTTRDVTQIEIETDVAPAQPAVHVNRLNETLVEESEQQLHNMKFRQKILIISTVLLAFLIVLGTICMPANRKELELN